MTPNLYNKSMKSNLTPKAHKRAFSIAKSQQKGLDAKNQKVNNAQAIREKIEAIKKGSKNK